MARTKKLDFTGVESFTKAAEGIHTAKVSEIVEKTTQGGDDMLQFAFEVIKGESKGCKVFESFVLTDKALWKLKSFLQAIGMKADGKLKIDLDKLIGKVCDIEVFWEEYNGQTRCKISDYYKTGKAASEDDDDDIEDDDDDAEEEEAPKKASAKRGRKKPEPEPEEDEEEEDEEEEPAPKKSKKVAKAPAKKTKKKPEPEPEDEDDDEDDDWEEDDD
jgi:hypothetical protein